MLDKLLTDDFQRRLGTTLSDKEATRLNNTVGYYMKQVYENPDNSRKSLQEMNREVLKVVVPDFQSYIRRQQAPSVLDPARADVTSQYDKLQAARQESQAKIPAQPNFQLSLEDADATPSIQRYEQLKQQRELEARRLEEAQNTLAPTNATLNQEDADDMAQMIQSDVDFRAGQRDALRRDAAVLSAREADKARQRQAASQVVRDVPPDPRMLYLGDQGTLMPRAASFPNANPTLALPNYIQTRPSLPQDIIKPQSDIVAYKENEYNLAVYSGDRDWVNNTLENRYNFTVNFDPANNRQGFGLSPSTYIKFKNISRIEMVKVIMPTEGLETVSLKTGAAAYDTSKIINVLSFPYLQVRIDELNTNNYGTNDGLNNSFGIISYEAYWASDQTLKNKGYTRMVPKFMKCQKIYHPTPLSTLQKLSIQIQRPDGNVITTDNDALDVSGVVLSSMLTGAAFAWGSNSAGDSGVGNSYYNQASSTTSSEYIWIQTKTWFSQFSVTQGDRILLSNLTYPSAVTASTTDFLAYLQRSTGHVVVDVGQSAPVVFVGGTGGVPSTTLTVASVSSGAITVGMKFTTGGTQNTISAFGTGTGGAGTYTITSQTISAGTTIQSVNFQDGANGSNKLGYSNFIIIRNSFSDPTTGATNPVALNSAFGTVVSTTPGLFTGRLLNTSHQIQMMFRVITRDMDSSTRLRPDNM
jgi:hypothetical protein